MKPFAFTVEITWLKGCVTGWGNGYVAVPEGHPLFKKHYDNIDIDIHGGLTFSNFGDGFDRFPKETAGMWVIGFDCAHAWDTPENCPKEYVEAEAQRLLEQVNNYSK